uniref:Uncharacterized protein n=1 Tax=Clandestinovirus TaxID=2831644 RepID=A0A8F8KNC2_9VIRU|nr:hypothetical protein KOM_12_41 [Clandestinovirus]
MADQVIPLIQKQLDDGTITKMEVKQIVALLVSLLSDDDPSSEPSTASQASKSESQSLFDDDNYCIRCGVAMGYNNPRQFCCGSYCRNDTTESDGDCNPINRD